MAKTDLPALTNVAASSVTVIQFSRNSLLFIKKVAAYNDKMHIHHCKTCDNRIDFAYVEIPYACKLLFQELITMNIAPRIMT